MSAFAKWTCFSVDIEANGPIPGDFSMIEIGAVKIERGLEKTFYTNVHPLNTNVDLSALESIGKTFMETMEFETPPVMAMENFAEWIKENTEPDTRPMLLSDNNGFDWSFINWYFIHFLGVGRNPFGYTSRNISDIYRGLVKNVKKSFKKLRDTSHTHNPVDDAMGNAEAVIKMVDNYNLTGLKI